MSTLTPAAAAEQRVCMRVGTAMLMSSLGVGMVQFFTVKERWSQGRARCQDF